TEGCGQPDDRAGDAGNSTEQNYSILTKTCMAAPCVLGSEVCRLDTVLGKDRSILTNSHEFSRTSFGSVIRSAPADISSAAT
ncbi:hypothetical protein AB4144_49380, partial [Rhizobiaceae sp. 2RAB30]